MAIPLDLETVLGKGNVPAFTFGLKAEPFSEERVLN